MIKKSVFDDDVPDLILWSWYLDEDMEPEKGSVIPIILTLYTNDICTSSRILKILPLSAVTAGQG